MPRAVVLLPIALAIATPACTETPAPLHATRIAVTPQAPSATAPERPAPDAEPPVTLPPIATEAWWSTDSPCPDGAVLVGKPPPDGFEVRCVLESSQNRKYGPTMEWYPNGRKRAVSEWKNGVIHGPFVRWYDSGQLELLGTYRDAKLQGRNVGWHPNGQKSHDGQMCDNQRCGGAWRTWFENGTLESESRFRDGLRDGRWSAWYEDGRPRWTGTYRAGKRDGAWTTWHESGRKATVSGYQDGRPHGTWESWDDTGAAPEPQVRWERGRVVAIGGQP